jgi:hypothetical protein
MSLHQVYQILHTQNNWGKNPRKYLGRNAPLSNPTFLIVDD